MKHTYRILEFTSLDPDAKDVYMAQERKWWGWKDMISNNSNLSFCLYMIRTAMKDQYSKPIVIYNFTYQDFEEVDKLYQEENALDCA